MGLRFRALSPEPYTPYPIWRPMGLSNYLSLLVNDLLKRLIEVTPIISRFVIPVISSY